MITLVNTSWPYSETPRQSTIITWSPQLFEFIKSSLLISLRITCIIAGPGLILAALGRLLSSIVTVSRSHIHAAVVVTVQALICSWFCDSGPFWNLNSTQTPIIIDLFRRSRFTLIDYGSRLVGWIFWNWWKLGVWGHKVGSVVGTWRNRVQVFMFWVCFALILIAYCSNGWNAGPSWRSTAIQASPIPCTLSRLMTTSNRDICEVALHNGRISRLSYRSVLLGAALIENTPLVGRSLRVLLLLHGLLLARKLKAAQGRLCKFFFDFFFEIDKFQFNLLIYVPFTF